MWIHFFFLTLSTSFSSIEGDLCASQQHRPPEVLPVPLVLVDFPGLGDRPPPPLQTGSLPPPFLQILHLHQTMGRSCQLQIIFNPSQAPSIFNSVEML